MLREEIQMFRSYSRSISRAYESTTFECIQYLYIALLEGDWMEKRIIDIRIFWDHEECDLLRFCEVFWLFAEVVEWRWSESEIHISESDTIHIFGEDLLLTQDMVDPDGVEGLEEFVHEISIFIDPESIPYELCRDRRSSFDHPSCTDIVNKTPSDPSVTDPVIVPEISILDPEKSTQIKARNILECNIAMSDTRSSNDLPDLLSVHISDHERRWKWREWEWQKIGTIEPKKSNTENENTYDTNEELHQKKDFLWLYRFIGKMKENSEGENTEIVNSEK